MSQDELDHILGSLDLYQIKNKTSLTLNPIIGYLKEFQDQQESGLTSFELPKRVKYSDWFPEASVTSNVSTILSREDTFSFVEFQAPHDNKIKWTFVHTDSFCQKFASVYKLCTVNFN